MLHREDEGMEEWRKLDVYGYTVHAWISERMRCSLPDFATKG